MSEKRLLIVMGSMGRGGAEKVISNVSEYFANTKEKAQKISDFLADFAPILSDFENAFKDKDTVLIGDLSEYEIAPRIAQMKEFCSDFIK